MKAVEILALQINHPAAMMSDIQQAQVAISRFRAKLSAEDFTTAQERGKALQLDAIVAELLSEN
jgi:hypothetical protein